MFKDARIHTHTYSDELDYAWAVSLRGPNRSDACETNKFLVLSFRSVEHIS